MLRLLKTSNTYAPSKTTFKTREYHFPSARYHPDDHSPSIVHSQSMLEYLKIANNLSY